MKKSWFRARLGLAKEYRSAITSIKYWRRLYNTTKSGEQNELISEGVVVENVIPKESIIGLLNSISEYIDHNNPQNDKNNNNVVDTRVFQIYDIDQLVENETLKNLVTYFADKLGALYGGRLKFDRTAVVYQLDDTDTSTKRSFHIDSYTGTHKAFLYLTDVSSPGYGAYCYVKGSHRKMLPTHLLSNTVNFLLNRPSGSRYEFKNKFGFSDSSQIKIITGDKGSAILSNQCGAHAGFSPQSDGVRKMIMFYYSLSEQQT